MAKLQIAREVLTRARERSNLTSEEQEKLDGLLGKTGGKGAVSDDVSDFPVAFLRPSSTIPV